MVSTRSLLGSPTQQPSWANVRATVPATRAALRHPPQQPQFQPRLAATALAAPGGSLRDGAGTAASRSRDVVPGALASGRGAFATPSVRGQPVGSGLPALARRDNDAEPAAHGGAAGGSSSSTAHCSSPVARGAAAQGGAGHSGRLVEGAGATASGIPPATAGVDDGADIVKELMSSVEAIEVQLFRGAMAANSMPGDKRGDQEREASLNNLAVMAEAAASAAAAAASAAAAAANTHGGGGVTAPLHDQLASQQPLALNGGGGTAAPLHDNYGSQQTLALGGRGVEAYMSSPTAPTPRQPFSSRLAATAPPGGVSTPSTWSASSPALSARGAHLASVGSSGSGGMGGGFASLASLEACGMFGRAQAASDEASRRAKICDEVCGLREEAIEFQKLQQQREAELLSGLHEALAAKDTAERQLAEARLRLGELEGRPISEERASSQRFAEASARDWASRFEEADRERTVFKQCWEEARHALLCAERECAALQEAAANAPAEEPCLAAEALSEREWIAAAPPSVAPKGPAITARRSLPARGRQGSLSQGLSAGTQVSAHGIAPGCMGRRSPEGGGLRAGAGAGQAARGRQQASH